MVCDSREQSFCVAKTYIILSNQCMHIEGVQLHSDDHYPCCQKLLVENMHGI